MKRAGRRVFLIGVRGALPAGVRPDETIRPGRLGRLLRILRQRGIRKVVLAGRFPHPKILDGFFPDWAGLRLLAGVKDFRGRTLLAALARRLAQEGIAVLRLTEAAPALVLRRPGSRDGGGASALEVAPPEARRALSLARRLAGLGIGQTICVRKGAVVAAEAMEGTDACIRRAGRICRGFLLAKAAGDQDPRFDLPVIGPTTIRTARRSGCAGIVAEAGKTLLISPEKTLALARRIGVPIWAV